MADKLHGLPSLKTTKDYSGLGADTTRGGVLLHGNVPYHDRSKAGVTHLSIDVNKVSKSRATNGVTACSDA